MYKLLKLWSVLFCLLMIFCISLLCLFYFFHFSTTNYPKVIINKEKFFFKIFYSLLNPKQKSKFIQMITICLDILINPSISSQLFYSYFITFWKCTFLYFSFVQILGKNFSLLDNIITSFWLLINFIYLLVYLIYILEELIFSFCLLYFPKNFFIYKII